MDGSDTITFDTSTMRGVSARKSKPTRTKRAGETHTAKMARKRHERSFSFVGISNLARSILWRRGENGNSKYMPHQGMRECARRMK